MDLFTAKQELEPVKKGGSWDGVFDALYKALLLRYFKPSHLQAVVQYPSKYASKKKLNLQVELGYLQARDGIFTATNKALETLTLYGYKRPLLPTPPRGRGQELYNTDVFVQALNLSDYFILLFPDFEYLKPDALLVRGTPECYKLEFLEVEASKTYWEKHLQKKKENYERLAKDEIVYRYWLHRANMLGMYQPKREEFCFCVCVVGDVYRDWEGWKWLKNLKKSE